MESRWRPKDLVEMRVNVIIGFPLGGLLALAIQAAAFLVFFEPGIDVEHISQTYDIAQYFGWSHGKVQPPARAARFTTVLLLLLLASTALALTTLDPITVTIVAVVCSAALLPMLFLPVLLIGNDREVMGDLANGPLSNAVATCVLAVGVFVSIAAFPLLILTRGGAG